MGEMDILSFLLENVVVLSFEKTYKKEIAMYGKREETV